MSSPKWKWLAVATLAVGLAGAATVWSLLPAAEVEAADHNDPSTRITADGSPMDRKADIADIYLWHQGTKIIAVLGFGGPLEPAMSPGGVGNYDRDVLFQLHISTDDNADTDEHTIDIRFGQDAMGMWGVRAAGVPGESGPVVGAVETQIAGAGGARVFAGLKDDPFFFDLQGFQETVAMGELRFMPSRDFFAGKNTTFVAFELDAADVLTGSDTTLEMWASSGRIAAGGGT